MTPFLVIGGLGLLFLATNYSAAASSSTLVPSSSSSSPPPLDTSVQVKEPSESDLEELDTIIDRMHANSAQVNGDEQ